MGTANEYLHSIPQILKMEDAERYLGRDVLLFSDKASFKYRRDDLVETNGLGQKWDKKIRDLIRIIKIENALDIKYKKTNVLTPLMFAESSKDIPWHLNTENMNLINFGYPSAKISRKLRTGMYYAFLIEELRGGMALMKDLL